MKGSQVASRIANVASSAWLNSQVMPTDEAVLYLQDALDVCRQLAQQLERAFERRALERAAAAAAAEDAHLEAAYEDQQSTEAEG